MEPARSSLPNAVRRRAWRPVLGVALAFTLLNAFKPLVVDDTAYYQYARQIAADPSDPYGFRLLWYEKELPAMRVLAPALFPYWWAGALAAFGDRPLLWKLSLFPFAWLLAAALHSLLSRVAPGLESPLLWMTMLSPALLPSFNLMLDVPGLALGLASLAVFARACERDRAAAALLAGLLVGLAMQTKYSGFLTLGALAAYAALHRRWRLGLVAVAAGAAVFAGWEAFLALRYGESHFLEHVGQAGGRAGRLALVARNGLGLLSLLGGVAPAIGLLGLAALRVPRPLVIGAGLACSLAFALLPALPRASIARLDVLPRLGASQPELFVLLPLGAGVAAIAAALLAKLLRAAGPGASGRDEASGGEVPVRLARFLLLWAAIELAGFFVLSPFLAARRVIGLGVVLTLAGGFVAARLPAPSDARRLVAPIACWGVALGLLFQFADLCDARARRDAVAGSAARLAELGADPERERLWFVGHWGFRFYAERSGMRPVVPGASRLARGDWLLVPEGVSRQHFRGVQNLTRMGDVVARSCSPWSTLPSAYAGPLPIRSQPDAQLRVALYRVERDFVPAPAYGRR